jgi:hypothetical protein
MEAFADEQPSLVLLVRLATLAWQPLTCALSCRCGSGVVAYRSGIGGEDSVDGSDRRGGSAPRSRGLNAALRTVLVHAEAIGSAVEVVGAEAAAARGPAKCLTGVCPGVADAGAAVLRVMAFGAVWPAWVMGLTLCCRHGTRPSSKPPATAPPRSLRTWRRDVASPAWRVRSSKCSPICVSCR